jgi:lysophospholipase L1-like esterase
MPRFFASLAIAFVTAGSSSAADGAALAGKRVLILGDSNTQAGGYVSLLTYFLEKNHPNEDFDIIGLGLASETVSGLSEENHAGGKFPRPAVFERLSRALEKTRPEIVFACYGMNDGIYLPLDESRFNAFKKGILRLIEECKKAGVRDIRLITPPIYDFDPKPGEFNYDTVLAAYAKWERELKLPGVTVIDLHSAMRTARAERKEPFSKDKVHPGDDGHLLWARVILKSLGEKTTDEPFAEIQKDPLFKLVAEKRALRSAAWMKHVGYTREVTVKPQPLGTAEADAAKLQEKIDALRRK